MGQIVPCKFQAFDATGAPLSGGKVYTYEPGTATKKTTYKDSLLITPNTNPVILDARGEAAIFGDGNFKIILSPSTDGDPPTSPIWTLDNIPTLGGAVYKTIWVPYTDFIALTTNGAPAGSNEYATNDIMMGYHAFDGATEEFVAFNKAMPEEWDRGAIKFKAYWAPGHADCSAGDTVEWEVAARAISNDDAIDAALGTGQVISDVVLAGKEGDLHITGASPALTAGGTPALGDLVHFKVSRNVGGTDNMAEDAWLYGIFLQIKLTKTIAAW